MKANTSAPNQLLHWRHTAVLLAALLLPTACENPKKRQAAATEMQALAEAHWPGKFVLHHAGLRGDLQGYEVIMTARDDPNFRLRLDHRELNLCQPQACAAMVQGAYAEGELRAARLNAAIAAFGRCDVPLLGLQREDIVFVVALDIHGQSASELARLTPCIREYWKELHARADALHGTEPQLGLRVQQIATPPVPAPARIDWDSPAEGNRRQPVYLLWLKPETPLPVQPAYLRLAIDSDYYDALESRILQNVQRHLKTALPGAGLNAVAPTVWKMKSEPQDLQKLHAYVLVCSPAAMAAKPRNCDEDMALQLRHDGRSQQTEVVQTLRDIHDHRGIVQLPALPGEDAPPRPPL